MGMSTHNRDENISFIELSVSALLDRDSPMSLASLEHMSSEDLEILASALAEVFHEEHEEGEA
jgi:hypothetical protein